MKRQTVLIPKKEIDQEGYDRIKQSIEAEKQQLTEIRSQIKAILSTDGSNLSESPSFLYLVAQESGKIAIIEKLQLELDSLIVVEKKETTDLVDLGDVVTLEIKYPNEDATTKKYRLVGSSPDAFKDEISQNGAIGRVIKGKPVGFSAEAVLPSGEIATIKIISKE